MAGLLRVLLLLLLQTAMPMRVAVGGPSLSVAAGALRGSSLSAAFGTGQRQRAPPTASASRRAMRRKRGKNAEARSQQFAIGEQLRANPTNHPPPAEGRLKPFQYLAVVDVEATCERNNRNFQHEIIELPVVLVDLESLEVVGEFHSYVKPTVNATLSEFCTQLTGIKQEVVDASPTLEEVLRELDAWLNERELVHDAERRDFVFAADGPWDLQFFLHGECTRKGIAKPAYFDRWVNLKQLFADFYRVKSCKIHKMLELQGMRFEGRLHSGIDDTRNIARIATQMAKDGCRLYVNEQLPYSARARVGVDLSSGGAPTSRGGQAIPGTMGGMFQSL